MKRLQHVVGSAGDDQQSGITDRRDGAVVPAVPDVADHGQGDQQRRKLGDSQHQRDQRQYPGPRNAGYDQGKTDEQSLDAGDTDDARGYCTNGRG